MRQSVSYGMYDLVHTPLFVLEEQRCWTALIAGGLIKFELPRAVLPAFADERVQARVSDINQQEEQVDNDLVQLQAYLEQLQFVELSLASASSSSAHHQSQRPSSQRSLHRGCRCR